MGFYQIALLFSLLSLRLGVSIASFHPVIQILPESRADSSSQRKVSRDDNQYCQSWRFTVETNNAGPWIRIPSRCSSFVKNYITGDPYTSDLEAVADASLAFAKTVKLSGDGKDAWVFDIDETLLSNIPYYADHGFG